MALSTAELVAALPVDAAEDVPPQEVLREYLQGLSHKPVPVGRLTRFWTLSTLQAKIAAGYLAYWIRSSYASQEARVRKLNETRLAAAIRLVGSMSYLRGAIMKIGQTLANYPDVMPAEYAELMGMLNAEAPPMHYALLREHVHNELGAEPEELFASFETEAFAAASLGQVHRATLKTGEQVVVKIQYPNIATTIRQDLANMRALMAPMRLTGDWDNIRAQFDDMIRVVELETDYEHEAESQRQARKLFAGHDDIFVPRVIDELSTRRVLTMEYAAGCHLPEFLKRNPTQEERDNRGTQMMFAVGRMFYRMRTIYADPNPGNFIFMDDGRLGLIDFGCCREFNDVEWEHICELDRCVYEDPASLPATLAESAMLTEKQAAEPDRMSVLHRLTEWYTEPGKYEGAFDFGSDEYFRKGMNLEFEIMRKRYLRTMQIHIWTNRCFIGIRALAYRLGARINQCEMLREERAYVKRERQGIRERGTGSR